MNKKGSLIDIFFLIAMLLAAAIVVVIVFMIVSKVNDKFQESDLPTEGKTIMSNAQGKYVNLFDGGFLVVFIGMSLLIIFLASQIDTNPFFMPLSIIIYIVLIIFSAIIGNTFYHVMENPALQEYVLNFRIIPFVFNNLVKIMLGLGVIVGVIMYAKQQ